MAMGLEIMGQATALAPTLDFPLYITPVHAGFPSPADDFIEARLDLNQHLVSHPVSTFFVRATGDSMINAGIYHGDLLIVDTSIEPNDGMVVVAVVNGEFTLKRLVKQRDKILLVSENPQYPRLEIKAGMDIEIWGVVLHAIHSFKRHG